MPTSQNGYTANNPALVSSRLVPGTTRKLRVRNGAAGDLLLWVASQFDTLVEDIEQGVLDDWGYAERPIRGSSTELSNHSSGTAIDLNATAHPLGTQPAANFSATEIARINEIVARTEGCVRWGGTYSGRKDGMHFEINDGVSEARCAAVLAKLTAGGNQPAAKPTVEELMKLAEPRSLPKSAAWTSEVFPIEVGKIADGGNSTVVAAMWLTLASSDFGDATGSTEYRLWAGDDAGHMIGFGEGSHPAEGTLENGGAMKGNDHRVFVLKKGTRVLTLEYRNNGKAQAGCAFPQVGQ